MVMVKYSNYEFKLISTLFCKISGLFQLVFLRFDNESNLNCWNRGLFVAELTIERILFEGLLSLSQINRNMV